MYVKIEPSGCCQRHGMVQVRLAMYLDEPDYGYAKHHVQVPVIPPSGYPGEVDTMGQPKDTAAFLAWLDALPKVWQNNPFHNHFIQVEPTTTDKEIADIAKAFLQEAYVKWATGKRLDLVNDALPFTKPATITPKRIAECEAKVQAVKQVTTQVRV
jgi:hypothetical protein